MLIPLLAQLETAVPLPETVSGGGGGRRKRAPVRRWRDPLYATEELQREGEDRVNETEQSDESVAAEIIAEAVTEVGGALMRGYVGGLEITLPDPPEPVSEAVLSLEVVAEWSDVLEAIKDAFRRERDRKKRASIMEYRAKVEAVRRKVERAREEEDEVEYLMAEGWL